MLSRGLGHGVPGTPGTAEQSHQPCAALPPAGSDDEAADADVQQPAGAAHPVPGRHADGVNRDRILTEFKKLGREVEVHTPTAYVE